jgi:dTDP-4-amino-4,6-dideoxygalactose transaminase
MNDLIIDWPSRGHSYTEDEISAVGDVMRSHEKSLTQGDHVKKFEKDLAEYIGVNEVFTTMSCAHALEISAMLLQINSEDEVIIPAHTYCATALAFARRGAKIVWGDINDTYLTLSPESIRKLITKNTKVVVIVHIYGLLTPQISEIVEICKKNNIVLIEDCAQALGSFHDNKSCGSFGDIACFSFHSQKNITTLGEGGAITVRDEELSRKIPSLRLNGHTQFQDKGDKYWLPAMTNVEMEIPSIYPIKSTMTEPQAVVGSLLIKRLNKLTAERRRRAIYFREELKNYDEIIFQGYENEMGHSHHLLPIKINSTKFNRDDVIKNLYENYRIKAIIQYYPLNRYDLFTVMGYHKGELPKTDDFFDNMLSIPFSVTHTWEELQYIAESIKSVINDLRLR